MNQPLLIAFCTVIFLVGCSPDNEIRKEGEDFVFRDKVLSYEELMELGSKTEAGKITVIGEIDGKEEKIDLRELHDTMVKFESMFAAAFSEENNEISFRKYLPSTAADVKEWSRSDGFLPDYMYLLKAKVDEEGFMEFVENLNLTPHSEDRVYTDDVTWLRWGANYSREEHDWWNPSSKLNDTFVSEGNDTWSFAKFENGNLYFKSLNH